MLLNTKEYDKVRYTWLENEINKLNEGEKTNEDIIKLVNKLYEKGYSSLDLMNLIEKNSHKITDSEDLLKIYTQLMLFNKVKTEFRNEKLFMTFILVN
jgi:transcriptional/translational regulatory protein YebC/TACO1